MSDKNKRYICYQILVREEGNNSFGVETYIYNVGAKSKEEAIGKFVLKTNDIKCYKKLDIFCHEVDEMAKID